MSTLSVFGKSPLDAFSVITGMTIVIAIVIVFAIAKK